MATVVTADRGTPTNRDNDNEEEYEESVSSQGQTPSQAEDALLTAVCELLTPQKKSQITKLNSTRSLKGWPTSPQATLCNLYLQKQFKQPASLRLELCLTPYDFHKI